MAVISRLEVNGKNITKYDNSIISDINLFRTKYNFANRNTVNGIKSINCDNAVSEAIYDMQIYGNSVQDGEPTTDNPVKIESVAEINNLVVVSKRTLGKLKGGGSTTVRNFEFDKYYVGLSTNNYYYETMVTYYSVVGDVVEVQPKGAGYGVAFPVEVKPNTQYALSWVGGSMGIGYYTKNGEYITNTYKGAPSVITTPDNCEIVTIICRPATTTEITTYTDIKFQEGNSLGGSAFGYRLPVKINGSTTNIYLNEPLRKVGNYADYIDYKNKKIIRHIASEKITTVTNKSALAGTYSIFLSNIKYKPIVYNLGFAISDKFKMFTKDYGSLSGYAFSIMPYITSTGINRVAYTFGDSSINSTTLAQAEIGDGFEVCYVMETPIEEDIDIPELATERGDTIVDIDTEVQPQQTNIEYWRQIEV